MSGKREDGARRSGVSDAVLAADALLVRTLHPVLGRFNLGIDIFRALRVLADSDGITVGDLGREIGANPPATTRIVDRLVGAGLAYRRADDDDRRRVLLWISEPGVATFHELLDALETTDDVEVEAS